MIEFPARNPALLSLASYYCDKLNKPLLSDFLLNNMELTNEQQALIICNQFQQLIDLAMLDDDKPNAIAAIENIETQLFSLFNLVYHAMLNLGFERQWQQAADKVRDEQSVLES